jgi:hypothetical protein
MLDFADGLMVLCADPASSVAILAPLFILEFTYPFFLTSTPPCGIVFISTPKFNWTLFDSVERRIAILPISESARLNA